MAKYFDLPGLFDPPTAPVEPGRRKIDHWCRMCGTYFQSPHARHLYCEPCSTSKDLERKRLIKTYAWRTTNRDTKRDNGIEISKAAGYRSLADPPHSPALNWLLRVCVPFSWSGSKNAIYALRRQGHVALRREANSYREALILKLKAGLRDQQVVQNKLWIDIFVEKNNHKGDAVNFVDTVCDAVKVATQLDDRWFCLRTLDWSICKHEPMLIVGIGQEKVEPVQACSYCGRLLPFPMFSIKKAAKNGIARICRDCGKLPKASP
jgi:hypothetical protein